MGHTAAAIERRRCIGVRRDGQPCRAWAVWRGGRQLCWPHLHPGPRGPYGRPRGPEPPTQAVACTCAGYAWPHRPGGGLCEWPDPPRWRLTTPAGTRSDWREWRRPSRDPVRPRAR